jgi:hypothetical protein
MAEPSWTDRWRCCFRMGSRIAPARCCLDQFRLHLPTECLSHWGCHGWLDYLDWLSELPIDLLDGQNHQVLCHVPCSRLDYLRHCSSCYGSAEKWESQKHGKVRIHERGESVWMVAARMELSVWLFISLLDYE